MAVSAVSEAVEVGIASEEVGVLEPVRAPNSHQTPTAAVISTTAMAARRTQ
jgi:hypothetical protein